MSQLLKNILGRGHDYQSNRVHAVLSGMFRFAKREKLISVNPMLDVERVGAEEARERVLDRAEIRKLWHVLGDDDYADQIRLMLLTGQRPGECAKLEWSEIDLETSWWTIPSGKSKNHQPHRVFLSPPAMKIITRHERTGSHVFQNHGGVDSRYRGVLAKACAFEKDWQLERSEKNSWNGAIA